MNCAHTFKHIFHPGLLIIHIALWFMPGVWYGLWFPATPLYLPLAAAIIFAIAALIFRRQKLGHILLLFFAGSIGIILGSQKLQLPQPPHIRSFIQEPTTLTCSGVITKALEDNGERVTLTLTLDTAYTPSPLTADSKQIRQNLFTTQTCGTIKLSMPAFSHNHLGPTDHITVQANLSPPRGFANPGGFNLPLFLQSRNIFISGWVARPEDIIKHRRRITAPWHLALHAEKIRSQLIYFYNSALSPSNASFYRALITGDRSGLSPQTQEMFKELGIYHLLAISGLHMGLLAGCIMWITTRILRQFPRLLLYIPSQQGAAAIAMLPVIFYCFISGLHPPAVRACLMTMILFSAFIFRKQWHGPTAIASAAIIILINNPLLLIMPSFQLSFIAVTAIVLMLPTVKSYLLPEKISCSRLNTFKKTILSSFFISLVASTATLPLLLLHFNRISLISPLTTLIIEPLLCLWALGFGLAGSFCSFLFPPLAGLLLQIGSLGFTASLWIGTIISHIPHLNLWLPAPSLWKITLFYSSIIIIFLFRNKRSLALFSFSFIILLYPQSPQLGFDRVTILDVGKGNSSIIQCASGETIIIDCGGPHGTFFNIGKQVIAPFLYHQQIRTIDLLVLSHADLDHYSGAAFIITHFKPKELWVPYTHSDNDAWHAMIKTAKKNGVTIRIPRQKESYPLKNDRTLTNISQSHLTKKNWSQNEQSLVIRFETGSASFLLPGDIGEKNENLLIHQNETLQSTVIVAPHHGSKSSSTKSFLKKVLPKYAVFSSSLYGKTTFPDPLIVKRYTDMGSIPLATATKGAITFDIKAKNMEVTTCLP